MYALIADIGGTNARFALVEYHEKYGGEDSYTIIVHDRFPVADYKNINEAIDHFLDSHQIVQPKTFAIAFACPVHEEVIKLTNSHWLVEKEALRKRYNLDRLITINDFAALAHAVPFLPKESLVKVSGSTTAVGNLAVVGPGTGLGVGGIIWPSHTQTQSSSRYAIVEGEGGHVTFAPSTEIEIQLHRLIQQKYSRISMERILQGAGLLLIYQSLCQLAGIKPQWHQPEQVSKAAIEGTCSSSKQALEVYCSLLGSFTGDLVLTLGARGGAYIGGGVVTRFIDFFTNSSFRKRFEDKGRFCQYMAKIPVYLIIAEVPAFDGIMRAIKYGGN